MAETVLYRKYRPGTFGEVLGQEQVVNVLEGALKAGRVAHAYLFTGSRGTGKTSIARILARSVGTADVDIVEIDAASYTGVDNIREVNEAARVLPFESKYKVYIVDEVHMLSKPAFNALLKTLEEPPAHVIFILATTEFHKVPETIISRCQTFSFQKPSETLLRELVMEIGKKEGFAVAPDAARLIALLGDGSFRDTHGTLQKVISAAKSKKIDLDEVLTITGSPRRELVHDLVTAMFDKDLPKALITLREAGRANLDMATLTKMLLHTLRQLMLMRYAPELAAELKKEASADELKFLEATLKKPYKESLSSMLVVFLDTYQSIGRSAIPELPLELAFVRLLGQNQ
ncbi:MAG: DNA polymerase III, subunit gamma and tau [Parcubacteria group bacterium RIFOXYD2_FULL_52_8]|nr:MAG: DNA polymerase III, subunit gamma and tau [Parcubacteria group bacterium RIFOXYD2_FULL_52_8]